MVKVTSNDGTTIVFERFGDGPPVVLVGAGRAMYRPLAEELAEHFTVFNYDRRGRGGSGDTAPYAVEREIEDLGAIIAEAGGTASVYGHSSGVALALRAATHGLPISRLVLHEPPYVLEDDEEGKRISQEFTETMKKLLAEGRHEDAIAHIFSGTGMPPECVEDLSRDEGVLAMVHTFAYDIEMDDSTDGTVPTDVAGAVAIPALVLDDGADYLLMSSVGKQLADAMPGGRHGVLELQDLEDKRYADPKVLAPVVAEFFAERDDEPDRAGR